jgi:hypothetical protein
MIQKDQLDKSFDTQYIQGFHDLYLFVCSMQSNLALILAFHVDLDSLQINDF